MAESTDDPSGDPAEEPTEDPSGEPAEAVQAGSGSSPAGVHQGNAIMYYADRYPTLRAALKEMVQNGIDQGASLIFVGIDLDKRVVIVLDNGKGTTMAGFNEALLNIGNSIKDADKLGEFGLGLVAPIDKCKTYTFASIARGAKKGHVWTFREEEVRVQHETLHIPWKSIHKLPDPGQQFRSELSGRFGVRYQTMIKMNGLTKDRHVSRIDLEVLVSEIRQNFGIAMQRKGVEVRIALISNGSKEVCDIEPQSFQGDPLDVVEYTDPIAGKVTITLFRAPQQRGRREGKVQVMRQVGDFGVTMTAFANQARSGKFWEFVSDAASVLCSGYFEGYIRCENITLRDDRESFKYNDPLHGLYLVLSTWYEEVGQALYEEEREDQDRSRYEDLANESLKRLSEQFPDADWKRFGAPSPDPGGSEKAEGETSGDDEPGTRGGNGTSGGRKPGGGSGEGERPTKPHPGGSGGTKKGSVSASSQGLSFRYDELAGNAHLWEFESSTGTLVLNIRHPDWVKLDETNGRHTARNDRWIMHLQEWLAIELLTLLAHFPTDAELDTYRTLIDNKIRPTIELHILGKR